MTNVVKFKEPVVENYMTFGYTSEGAFSAIVSTPCNEPFENVVNSIKPTGLRFAVILGQN